MAEANRRLAPLYIKGPGYEEFVAALTEIAYAACEHGAQTFQALGKPFEDIPGDEELRRQFMAACHEGFNQAQAAIGQLIIELDANLRDAERDRAEARRNHDREKAQDLALRIEGSGEVQSHPEDIGIDVLEFTVHKKALVSDALPG